MVIQAMLVPYSLLSMSSVTVFFIVIMLGSFFVKFLSVGLCLLFFGASFNLAAAGKVNYLNVNGDVVHFATDTAKSVASPSCATAETNERFTVSLQTESGRGMYSLLVTAMASDLALEVESAQDCAVAPGVERALGVSIVPVIANNTFQGTILDNVMEVSSDYFGDSEGYSSDNSSNYYVNEFNLSKGAWGKVTAATRTRIASVEGSGWLTGILTPANRDAVGHNIQIEVIIDGVNQTFTLQKGKDNFRRWFIGLGTSGGKKSWIAPSAEVVGMGLGVRFEQSMEVLITMGSVPSTSSSLNHYGVRYLLGGSKQ